MALSGVQKAALLLTGLDPETAGELLKATPPEVVTQIAAELLYLDATGQHSGQPPNQPATEFVDLLHNKRGPKKLKTFIRNVITSAVGEEKSKEVLGEVQRIVDGRDPFIPIRSADVESLAQALDGQHPQAAALVLSELPPEKSAALVPLLGESVRGEAVRRMTRSESVSLEAQARVAAIVRNRLDTIRQSGGQAVKATPNVRLRRVALLLRNLRRELRDSLIETINQHDSEMSTAIRNLMVTWEDIPVIADRNLQEALRSVEAQQLALALQGADPKTEAKIRANISERAGAMIDEEISLMRAPKPEDIEAARETILGSLRQVNASGELRFEESKANAAGS